MPWENIGSISTGDMPHEERWILWSLRLAKKYVELVCGDPPLGCELNVMWHEHDLGAYPSLGVWFEYGLPTDYISCCEQALEIFDNAVSWYALKEHFEEVLFTEEDEEI